MLVKGAQCIINDIQKPNLMYVSYFVGFMDIFAKLLYKNGFCFVFYLFCYCEVSTLENVDSCIWCSYCEEMWQKYVIYLIE